MKICQTLVIALCAGLPLALQAQELKQINLSAGIYPIRAEVAASPASRERGLMYRDAMPEQAGMLFVFESSDAYCFWMKNTRLALSIAFINTEGRIVNMADMQPQTENSHCALKPVLYALEMNQGWFRKKGIKAGAKISGINEAGY